MSTEPTTEAGKALLRSDFDTTGWGPAVVREHVTRAVLAIEAEAREQGAKAERKRLLALAEAWTSEPDRVFDRIFLRRLLSDPGEPR